MQACKCHTRVRVGEEARVSRAPHGWHRVRPQLPAGGRAWGCTRVHARGELCTECLRSHACVEKRMRGGGRARGERAKGYV